MSEHEKQLHGKWYNPASPDIVELQNKSRLLMRKFNSEIDKDKRYAIMKEWFKEVGEGTYIVPHFFCDFGCHLTLGKRVYFNTNCTILDSAFVVIGDDTWIGSGVQICTPIHSIYPEKRMNQSESERAESITIGKQCWIGSGVIILGGISISDGATVVPAVS